MNQKVTKAIITVAGTGTRILPASKTIPKEMLSVIDKPIVQYLVEEAADSGIDTVIFVINKSKHSISDYFAQDKELEQALKRGKKIDQLNDVRNINAKKTKFIYVYQEITGNGGVLLSVESLIERNEPFAVFFADDIIKTKKIPAIQQLMRVYEKYEQPVAGLINVPKNKVNLYGVIDGEKISNRIYKINGVIEKPETKKAPSSLVVAGRYILNSEIFQYLKKAKPIKGEIYLSTAVDNFIKKGDFYGVEMNGIWYDCGSKLGLWQANLIFGLEHPSIMREAKKFLSTLKK